MAKILLIDDSWLTRRGLIGLLAPTGHEIVEAENGKQGLEIIEENPPDFIFLDLLMPDVDGYEVLQKMQEKGLEIPVVVCSADIQDTAKKKCIDLGAFDFLNKPPSQEDVMNVLERVL